MGWNRNQHDKQEYKRPRHARIPLCIEKCSDCGKTLRVTYMIARFLGRCRPCFDLYAHAGASHGEMASH